MAKIYDMVDELYDYCATNTCGDYPCVGCIFNKIPSCDFVDMDEEELLPLYNMLKEGEKTDVY